MVEKVKRNENEVIISVYVESRILRSDQKIGRIKRINPVRISSQPRVSKSQCYDRRAQLLAYAQELKHADAKQLKRPKSKKQRWAVVRGRIRRLFSQFRRVKVKGLWKYESIDGEGRWSYGRRKKIHFCKKLKCLLKKIPGAWTCNNGATD